MDKYELADMLREIAELEKGFKSRAFSNASDQIIIMSNEEFNSITDFKILPGIGPSVANCIAEFRDTGQMSRLTKLRDGK